MNNPLRDLAKSEYAQNMYRASKEINGISLFENSKNLGRLQIIYLSFLALYDSVYTDIASDMLDDAVMDMERIKNDFLVDCYLTYKRKNRNKKNKTENKKQSLSGIPSISFVSGKKRR